MKAVYTYVILIFCFFMFFTSMGQQEVVMESFSQREGIDIKWIKSIVEDADGFIWISGEKPEDREIINSTSGNFIQRFDGQRFRSIYLEGMDENEVLEYLYPQPSAELSIHTKIENKLANVYLFNTRTFALRKLDLKNAKYTSKIFSFDGKSYILTQSVDSFIHVNNIDNDGSLTEVFQFKSEAINTNLDSSVNLIKVDNQWIVSGNYFPIMIFSEAGNLCYGYSAYAFNRKNGLAIEKLIIRDFALLDGCLYAIIDSTQMLYRYNPANYAFEPTDIVIQSDNSNIKIFQDAAGVYVVATVLNNELLLYYLTDDGTVSLINSTSLKKTTTVQLHSSNNNDHLWIATNNREVYYFKVPSNQFKNLLPDKQLRAIKKLNDNSYLIATEVNGWFLFNEGNGEVNKFNLTENNISINLNSSRNFVIDRDTIWSNSGGSIVSVDKNTGKVASYRNYPVSCFLEINDSTLLLGTNKYNLLSFNTRTKSYQKLVNTDSLYIHDLAYNPKSKKVFAATSKGLLSYNVLSKTIKWYDKEFNDAYLLMVDFTTADGFLLGSRNGTIYKYNEQNDNFDIFYEDALRAGIATVTRDDETYWISTFEGLVHFKPIENTRQRFSVNDGLSHNEGNRYSSLNTARGMLVGSISGLNYFNPKKVQPQEIPCELKFLKASYFDNSLNDYSVKYASGAFAKAEKIILPAEHRSIDLEFAVSNVDPLRGETYRYRLNDGSWQDLQDRRTLGFNNLSAGDYKLEIQAMNYSGAPIPGIILLNIVAQDFFYKEWWFFLVLLLTFSLIAGYVIYQSVSKRKNQEVYSRNLITNREEERMRIAKELHDSVGQHLTLIKQTAQNNALHNLAAMTNATLEEVRSISRGLYPASLNQLGLTATIEHLLLDVDEQTDLFVSMHIDSIDALFNENQALNIYRFIQEGVSNVLKHANAKALEVKIENVNGLVKIEIIDNGNGFDKSNLLSSKSLGVKTMKERIKIMKGTFTMDSISQQQTILTAIIPHHNVH
jgi:signal transduction histidine kinase